MSHKIAIISKNKAAVGISNSPQTVTAFEEVFQCHVFESPEDFLGTEAAQEYSLVGILSQRLGGPEEIGVYTLNELFAVRDKLKNAGVPNKNICGFQWGAITDFKRSIVELLKPTFSHGYF